MVPVISSILSFTLLILVSCSGGGGGVVGNGGSGGGNLGSSATTIEAGKVTFVNNCAVSLTLKSDGPIQGTLVANVGTMSVAVSAFNQGANNVIMPYPNTSASQCTAVNCDGWKDLGGLPGTTQREGFMWDPPNDTYAAYCNPNLSGRAICALQNNCCGPGMVQDGTYGTHWEFTPKGDHGSIDSVNLSTNYGSGPRTPPHLCPFGDGTDCVAIAADIFFNVPVKWTTNMSCLFTTAQKSVMGGECRTANCPDAYQHPKDDKQCTCSSSSDRGYLVEFCPAGSPLPPTPG